MSSNSAFNVSYVLDLQNKAKVHVWSDIQVS